MENNILISEALQEELARWQPVLYAIAWARLHDHDAAEDLVQEVFLRALVAGHDLRQPKRFEAWICQVARHLATDWTRRKQTRSRLLPLVPLHDVPAEIPQREERSPREMASDREEAALVHQALTALPPAQAEVILLHFSEDLNCSEIARLLGVHPSTAARTLERALGNLARRLAPPSDRRRLPAASNLLPRPSARSRVRLVRTVAAVGALSAAARNSVAQAAMHQTPGAVPWLCQNGVLPLTFLKWGALPMKSLVLATVAAAGLAGIGIYFAQSTPPATGTQVTTPPPAPRPFDVRQALLENEGSLQILTASEYPPHFLRPESQISQSSPQTYGDLFAEPLRAAGIQTVQGPGGGRAVYAWYQFAGIPAAQGALSVAQPQIRSQNTIFRIGPVVVQMYGDPATLRLITDQVARRQQKVDGQATPGVTGGRSDQGRR